MNNIKLSDLYITQESNDVEISLEELINLRGMSSFFTGFITKFTAILDNRVLVPAVANKLGFHNSAVLLKKYSKLDLENFVVLVPEYFDGKIIDFLKTLSETLADLQDIDKLLLDPLEKWAANMISTPGYDKAIWINTHIPNLRDSVLEKNSEKLKKCFNAAKGDDVSYRQFYTVYSNIEEYEECSKIIEDLVNRSTKFLDGKLSKKATEVANLILRLSKNDKVENLLQEIPFEKMKPVTDLVSQTAKELEQLSIVLFHIRCVSYAEEQTVKKINNELKK